MLPILLPVLGAALAWVAITTSTWVLLWPAAVVFATAAAYVLGTPRVFGKRRDGTLAWYAWIAWGPLFSYQWLVHELMRRLTREPVANEVAPGLWVARRPRLAELPPEVAIVVDLCAEFPAASGIALGRAYLAIPTLDTTAPTPRQIVEAVEAVLAANGSAFVHCAFGHGRSATVAAAVMIRRGDATLEDVEHRMRAVRPRIGLNSRQRAALAEAARIWQATSTS